MAIIINAAVFLAGAVILACAPSFPVLVCTILNFIVRLNLKKCFDLLFLTGNDIVNLIIIGL